MLFRGAHAWLWRIIFFFQPKFLFCFFRNRPKFFTNIFFEIDPIFSQIFSPAIVRGMFSAHGHLMYWACKTSRATSAHPGGMLLAHAHLTCNIFEVPMHSGGIICPDSDDDGLSTQFFTPKFLVKF